MIASWIMKRMVRSVFDTMSQDDFNVKDAMAGMSDDAVYDLPSDLGIGETLTGKKAITEWFERWKKEFPKRKLVVKNICMRGTCLPSPTNIMMVEWSCWERDTKGQEFQFDGVSVFHIRNAKTVHGSDYVSFKGLPQLSNLIKPVGKA